MKEIIIAIDHGYSNIKTVNTCFRTGVIAHEGKPAFTNDLLIYDGHYYTIGEGHKEYSPIKTNDQDYYILTLAAIARELNLRGLQEAKIIIAAGLPLTWVKEQGAGFRAYLLQKPEAEFSFRDKDYRVEIADALIYPQGFAAVVDRMKSFVGINMLADIGNGTMNIMQLINRKPIQSSCITEFFGTHQCTLAIREQMLSRFGKSAGDSLIDEFIRNGKADIDQRYQDAMRQSAMEYVAGIFRRLREHGYDPELMKLYVVGGGGCLIKHFAEVDPARVVVIDDIHATAKGYEYMAKLELRSKGLLQ